MMQLTEPLAVRPPLFVRRPDGQHLGDRCDICGIHLVHGGNLPVTQPALLPDQSHKIIGQVLFIFTAPRDLALCRPVMAQRRTGPSFGDRQR